MDKRVPPEKNSPMGHSIAAQKCYLPRATRRLKGARERIRKKRWRKSQFYVKQSKNSKALSQDPIKNTIPNNALAPMIAHKDSSKSTVRHSRVRSFPLVPIGGHVIITITAKHEQQHLHKHVSIIPKYVPISPNNYHHNIKSTSLQEWEIPESL